MVDPVTNTTKQRRAPFPIEFYRSAVGKKWVMAVTGLAIILFTVAHMIGNWKIFLPDVGGVPEIDHYGHALRELVYPLLPKHVVLWVMRTGLIVVFLLHVHAEATHLLLQFLPAPLARVGEKEEFLVLPAQPVDELGHPRQQPVTVIDDTVHVADESTFRRKVYFTHVPQRYNNRPP